MSSKSSKCPQHFRQMKFLPCCNILPPCLPVSLTLLPVPLPPLFLSLSFFSFILYSFFLFFFGNQAFFLLTITSHFLFQGDCVLSGRYVEVEPLVPVNMTLFRNRVSADVMKL